MTFNVFTGLIAGLAATAAALPHSHRDLHRVRAGESGIETRGSGGGVQIVNNMDTDVYLWSTSAESGSMQTLSSGGGDYSEDWDTNSNGGGISIKMSTSQDESSVLQFEYTQNGDTLFWDMSSIDLDSSSDFIKSGFTAEPTDSSCRSATCAAGDANCKEAYQKPDDVNTYSCSLSSGFTLTLG